MNDRTEQIIAFLARAGWGDAVRAPLAGDASFRRYDRLRRGDQSAVLMDAPPPHEDVRPFVRVAGHLHDVGLSAPTILAADADLGLLLLEDLGDASFSRVLAAGGDEQTLYRAAVDTLVRLQEAAPAADLPDYDRERLLNEAALLTDWFLPAEIGIPCPADLKAEYVALWNEAFADADSNRIVVLRDFHADNLMWLPERNGVRRVGLLDFQDAVLGAPAYDLVSLLEDARRDVPASLAAAMVEYFCTATRIDQERFAAGYAMLGAQRNSKILGIFVRLWRRDRKPQYRQFLHRVWRLLQQDLQHPSLARLRAFYDRSIPPPKRTLPR